MHDRRPASERLLPDPRAFVDPAWNPIERDTVLEHLRIGTVLYAWRGYAKCRLCGIDTNGSKCLTDGKWAWPEGLAHYVEEHHVRLPKEFIAHIGSLPSELTSELRRHHKAVDAGLELDPEENERHALAMVKFGLYLDPRFGGAAMESPVP